MNLKLFIATIICLLNIVLNLQDVQAQNTESKIDSLLLNTFKEDKGPGGVFLVAKHGKSVYKKAFGLNNIELSTPMTTNAIFEIGSMSKQFTAIAVLMLEEQGKLSINDKVIKYVPDFPNGNNITLHHLLTHTSGIKDFTRMKAVWDIAKKDLSPKEMVDFFKNEPVDFKPGDQFQYNNSGYVLLGCIIEEVSGQTYEDFIEKEIFKKLGMVNSRYADHKEVIKNRAYGYHGGKDNAYTNKTYISYNIPLASGSLMSSVDDMLIWQNALNKNVLLKKATQQKAFTNYTLNNGDKINYGYGWHLKEINGTPNREHGGSIFGYKSMGIYIPQEDLYVIGFSNCDCNSPTQIARDIAKIASESND